MKSSRNSPLGGTRIKSGYDGKVAGFTGVTRWNALCWRLQLRVRIDHGQRNDGGIDHDLAGMLEVDGDAGADRRLDLAETPVRLVGMADDRSRNDERVVQTLPPAVVASDVSFPGIDCRKDNLLRAEPIRTMIG